LEFPSLYLFSNLQLLLYIYQLPLSFYFLSPCFHKFIFLPS
jgi:hypothetical protein